MTTANHTPYPTGGPLTAAAMEAPLGQLDAAIANVIATGSGASTTLTAQANAGQKNLVVASGASFVNGMSVWIGDSGGTHETGVVATGGGTGTLVLVANLANTYAIGKPVSASPIELVDARGGQATLGAFHDVKLGGVVSRGAGASIGLFGITDAPSNRIPVNIAAPITGPAAIAAGTSNVIGIELSPRFTGNFTGIGGADPGYVWGASLFTTVGAAATDGDGIIDLTGLVSEIALQSSATDQGIIRAMHANTSLWGASSAGHVDQIEGLRISPPAFKDGATTGDWTIDIVYGLFVEDPGTVGTNRFAIFTEGGPSRFTGRLDVYGDIVITGKFTIGGASFPGGPATNDVCYRTDRGRWYYWDGARWLSTAVFALAVPGQLTAHAATNTEAARAALPSTPAGIMVVGHRTVYYSPTNDGTQYWTMQLQSYDGNTATNLGTNSTQSLAANAWTPIDAAINTVVGAASDWINVNLTKVSTAGDVKFMTTVLYREVG
jgi:hypothetical protein